LLRSTASTNAGTSLTAKWPAVGDSIANYDDNQHAEDENLRFGNLWDGIAVYAGLLSELKW